MIKGPMSGADGNCLSRSEERKSSPCQGLGNEEGQGCRQTQKQGTEFKAQLCPNVGDLGQRAVFLWASVSSSVKQG